MTQDEFHKLAHAVMESPAHPPEKLFEGGKVGRGRTFGTAFIGKLGSLHLFPGGHLQEDPDLADVLGGDTMGASAASADSLVLGNASTTMASCLLITLSGTITMEIE